LKRSEINALVLEAKEAFESAGWALPPFPCWDVTDFGLGNWERYGLILINLADEREYCEKLMFARSGMETPPHTHALKKEDIVARRGTLRITLWRNRLLTADGTVKFKLNGEAQELPSSSTLDLPSGHRITLLPGVYHAFVPVSETCILSEVSTANDDLNDNFFVNPLVGRFAQIEEDEPPIVRLVSD